MELVAFLGRDKENWGQVNALVNRAGAEKILLVRSRGMDGFPANEKCEFIDIDCDVPLLDLKDNIAKELKPRLSGEFEVSLSLASGNGKEHMALISALLSIPVGIRLVIFSKKGIEVIN